MHEANATGGVSETANPILQTFLESKLSDGSGDLKGSCRGLTMANQTLELSVAETIGAFIARGSSVDAQEVRETVRDCVTDALGCMIVGAATTQIKKLCMAFKGSESGNAQVYGTAETLTPQAAALVNGASAHIWDLDDWEDMGNTHPSAVLVPAMLAVASYQKCSGAEFLQAYATGFDVIARLGAAATNGHYQAGFHVTGTIGAFGAAAATSRLMGLEADQACHAIALTASQAMGLTAQFGSDAKALQAGFAAQAGLKSAQMAKSGLRGKLNILEADNGFFATTCPGWAGDLSPMFKLEGIPALAEGGVYLKAYPSCAYSHRLISCAEEIAAMPGFDAQKITRIDASLPDFHMAIMPFSLPTNQKEALFSLEFSLAQTLLGRAVSVEQLCEGAWQRQDCRDLAQKIVVTTHRARNPQLPMDPGQPDELRVACGDQMFHATCDWPKGAPVRPLDRDDILAKFRNVDLEDLFDWPACEDVRQFFGRY